MTADTRLSWNIATQNHNAHKGDQVAPFREGRDPLFPEELELLGELSDKEVVHLQCNSGQDTLGLVRRGAKCTGVDLSDEAIAFARKLSTDTGLAADFEQAEIVSWMHETTKRFDIAFASYGVLGWNRDLAAWMRGVERILKPGGKLVLVEFHPLVWSIDADLALHGDDYFESKTFLDPVGDYVAESATGLGAVNVEAPLPNEVKAESWQYTLADTITAIATANLRVERLLEWPHANGCRVIRGLVAGENRQWLWPEGFARLPVMFGVVARKSV